MVQKGTVILTSVSKYPTEASVFTVRRLADTFNTRYNTQHVVTVATSLGTNSVFIIYSKFIKIKLTLVQQMQPSQIIHLFQGHALDMQFS